jgi:hypothetical protein
MSHLRTAAFISSLGCLGLWACGPRDPAGQEPDAGVGDVDAAPRPDAEIWPDANPCELGVVCGTDCCRDDEVCAPGHEVCVPDMTCDSNDDCQNDSYCDPETSLCLPYDDGEVDETCTQINVVGVFAPDVQCEWLGPPAGDAYPGHLNVLATPVVVDFDFDGDGGTIEPSIIFPSYNGEDGGAGAAVGDAVSFGVIRVIDGSDCAQQHTLASPTVIAASPLAVADLDLAPRRAARDPGPEGRRRPGGVPVRPRAGGLHHPVGCPTRRSARARASGTGRRSTTSMVTACPRSSRARRCLNGQTGVLLDGSMSLRYVKAGQIPVVADLYQDGKPELIAGDATWEWNAGTHTWVAATSGTGSNGLVAVADFGTYGEVAGADDRATLDGIPEVAVSASGSLRVQTIGGRVIHGPISITPGGGGPPTISDLDGDGRVEVGVASQAAYRVIDLDCVGPTPDPAACASERTDGILWSMATQDISSSYTGSSVFDFEGDGKAEVVYADECFSRVYDGRERRHRVLGVPHLVHLVREPDRRGRRR